MKQRTGFFDIDLRILRNIYIHTFVNEEGITSLHLIFFRFPPSSIRWLGNTEMKEETTMMYVNGDKSDGKAPDIDNLLYISDAEYSCFADLAFTSLE